MAYTFTVYARWLPWSFCPFLWTYLQFWWISILMKDFMGLLCTKVMYLWSFFRDRFQLLSLGKIWLYTYLHQDCVRELVWVCFGGFSPSVWREGWFGCLAFFPSQKLSTRMFEVLKRTHIVPAPRGPSCHGCLSLVFGITPFPHKVVGG